MFPVLLIFIHVVNLSLPIKVHPGLQMAHFFRPSGIVDFYEGIGCVNFICPCSPWETHERKLFCVVHFSLDFLGGGVLGWTSTRTKWGNCNLFSIFFPGGIKLRFSGIFQKNTALVCFFCASIQHSQRIHNFQMMGVSSSTTQSGGGSEINRWDGSETAIVISWYYILILPARGGGKHKGKYCGENSGQRFRPIFSQALEVVQHFSQTRNELRR